MLLDVEQFTQELYYEELGSVVEPSSWATKKIYLSVSHVLLWSL